MKKYRLIKEYPGSSSLGTIFHIGGFAGDVSKYPEFFEEVIEKDYEVLIAKTVPYTILSVKRLSDGEVFTVGDRAKVYEYGSIKTIDSMTLVTECSSMKEGIWLNYNSGSSHIVHATKQEKQPIFLTHDGKDIFVGDKVWWVNKKTFYSDYFVPTPSVTFFSDLNAYFLTKEAAEDYISRNKVLFTTEDGKDIFKGDQVWYVHKGGRNMSINYLIPSLGTTFRSESYAYFLTREAAEDYILRNKVLFITEDGVGIKVGDTYYFVDTNLKISLAPNANAGSGWYDEIKYFSTYETAQYYVIVNAKVLSIEEFWEFVSKPGSNIVKQKALKRLVKERLNLK